jgi:hypothetical protein
MADPKINSEDGLVSSDHGSEEKPPQIAARVSPNLSTSLFRKKAMAKLSSPEHLDEPVRTVPPLAGFPFSPFWSSSAGSQTLHGHERQKAPRFLPVSFDSC